MTCITTTTLGYSVRPEGRGASSKGYYIDPRGWVYSNKTRRILKSSCNGRGYQHVVLRLGGRSVDRYVHRLVAEEHLANPLGLREVNHKDGDKSNNHVENLEWVSSSGNKTHAVETGLRPLKPVAQYRLDGTLVKTYPSARDAEEFTGIRRGLIRGCCNGGKKTSHGFIWKYQDVT